MNVDKTLDLLEKSYELCIVLVLRIGQILVFSLLLFYDVYGSMFSFMLRFKRCTVHAVKVVILVYCTAFFTFPLGMSLNYIASQVVFSILVYYVILLIFKFYYKIKSKYIPNEYK